MSLTANALTGFIEKQIFFPDPHLYCTPAEEGLEYEDVRFETSDRVSLHSWLVPAPSSPALLLFCHGNAGNISHRVDNVRRLHEIGLSVLIFDYRGYGLSKGRITEAGFYLDAEAAYDTARSRAEAAGQKLVIFGRSLGGIAAVYLAASRPCAGLILESTFTNMAAMAREHFPLPVPESLLRDRLNSLNRIDRVTAPVLFFHGDCDDIVPMRLGQELYDATKAPKEFVTLAGAGHNDTYLIGGPEYFRKFRSFIDKLPSTDSNRKV